MTPHRAENSTSEKHRQYAGQEDAQPVIGWLNKNAASQAGQRIAALVRDLASLSRYRQVRRPPTRQDFTWLETKYPELRKLNLRDYADRPWPKAWAGQGYDLATLKRARGRLLRYTFHPYLVNPWVRGEARDSLLVVWRPSRRLSKAGEQEAAVISLLVGLVEDRLIDKIRECSCGTWFFPKKSESDVCSRECYRKKYSSTEEFKEARRKYMKKRYQEQVANARLKRLPRKK